MKYVSTRKKSPPITFAQALHQGLAPDGGLFVPETIPVLDITSFHSAMSVPELGARLLAPFLAGDRLERELPSICAAALDFPLPLRFRPDGTAVLELFHGPTAAFKDVGARFLAEYISREVPSNGQPRTVIVATSGDTGGAVAGAFFGKPGIEVLVLFPKGKISARQEKQIAGWGGNVRAIAVRGTFDDCQRVVKEALTDADWRARRTFISANSISIGRLLPQMIYYAKASLEFQSTRGRTAGFIVPTGNLGNAVAALWAKRVGFPIGSIVLATNANRSIPDFFASGEWKPKPTIATLANAMDVGNPSNMERLLWLYPDLNELKKDVKAISVSDPEIRDAIRSAFMSAQEAWCPHTATACVAQKRLGGTDWVLVATAHPAKFETIVEPLIGAPLPVPPALNALLNRAESSTEIEPTLSALKAAVPN